MDPHTANRYLTYFDIMGFTDRYTRKGHDSVLAMMGEFCTIVETVEKSSKFHAGSALSGHAPDQRKIVEPVLFSDTVLLYSYDDSSESLQSLLYLSSYFFSRCLELQIPLKGAIAKGMFTADKSRSLYLGQPLIDAYKLGTDAHFYGAVFHHSVQDDLLDVDSTFHFPAKAPLKSGRITHSVLRLLPASVKVHAPDDEALIRRFYASSSGCVRKYVDNTLEVYFPQSRTE